MAFFISLEGGHPLPDIDGKGLSRAWNALEPLCEPLGVASLMDFFSASEAQQLHYDIEESQVVPEQWFAATEGLATVRALREYVACHAVTGMNVNALTDLKNFETALSAAEQGEVRWHLSVDD